MDCVSLLRAHLAETAALAERALAADSETVRRLLLQALAVPATGHVAAMNKQVLPLLRQAHWPGVSTAALDHYLDCQEALRELLRRTLEASARRAALRHFAAALAAHRSSADAGLWPALARLPADEQHALALAVQREFEQAACEATLVAAAQAEAAARSEAARADAPGAVHHPLDHPLDGPLHDAPREPCRDERSAVAGIEPTAASSSSTPPQPPRRRPRAPRSGSPQGR